jgi:hypothetical protein
MCHSRTAILKRLVFVIKAEVHDLWKTLEFTAQKTMYGGKSITKGDVVFIFASENEGGRGLIARGIVSAAESIAKKTGITRQTPRVSVSTFERLGSNFCAEQEILLLALAAPE